MAGIFREKVLGESSHGEPLPGKRHAAETRGELYFRSQAFPKWMAQNCSAVVDSPLSSLFFFFFGRSGLCPFGRELNLVGAT